MARIPASNPITTEAVAEKQYPDLFISRITVQHIPNMLAKMSISASAYNYDTEEILSPKQVEVYHVKDLQAEVQRLPVLRDVLIKLRRVSGLMLWENRIVKFIDKTTERIAIIDELIASGVGGIHKV